MPCDRSERMRPIAHRARGGFSLIEVTIALAILVMIAAAVTPSLLGFLDRTRVERGYESIVAVRDGVARFKTGVSRYPQSLQQLSQPITTAQRDVCNTLYNSTRVNNWLGNGPFFNRVVPSGGLPIFIGTAQSQITRTTSGNNAWLSLQVNGVRPADALAIDARFDGDGGRTTGTVQWTDPPAANGLVTMFIVYPVGNANNVEISC